MPEGTFLDGEITLIGQQKRNFSYTSDFYGYSGTTLTIRNIPQLVWATETLEVYSVSACTDFPSTAYTQMYSILIQLKGGTIPGMSWSVSNVSTSCGVQTTVPVDSANGGVVNIYY